MGCLSLGLGCLGGSVLGLALGGLLTAGFFMARVYHVPERASADRVAQTHAALIDGVRQRLAKPEELRRWRPHGLVAVRHLANFLPEPGDPDLLSGAPRRWGAHAHLDGGYGLIEEEDRLIPCLIHELSHGSHWYWVYLADPQAASALERQ